MLRRRDLLSTDTDWRCRVDKSYVGRDKIGYDTQFLEHRDLRIAPTEWERVRVRDADYTFADDPFPMLDIYPVDPRAFCERNGSIVYDFGGEVVGGLVVTVTAKRDGAELELRCAEELDGGVEGELDQDTRIRYKTRANCNYCEKIILTAGRNTIDQYDYKAFRYAELVYGATSR